MKRWSWRVAGATAGVTLVLVACSQQGDSSTSASDAGAEGSLASPNGSSEAGSGVDADSADGADSSSADGSVCDGGDGGDCGADTVEDAGPCTPPLPGVGSACNSLASPPPATSLCDPGSPPAMTGGPIREGVYVEASATVFGPGCTPSPLSFGETIQVCGGVWFGDSMTSGTTNTTNSTISVSDQTLTLTTTCNSGPPTASVSPQYTATDTEIRILYTVSTPTMIRFVRQN